MNTVNTKITEIDNLRAIVHNLIQNTNEAPIKKKVVNNNMRYSRPLIQSGNSPIIEEIPQIIANKSRENRAYSLPSNTGNTFPTSSNQISPRTLIIPWRNQILTPSYFDLLKFKGNLDAIMKNLGSRPPNGQEKNWRFIRIYWRGKVLWPTPNQLLQAGGDLNILLQYPQITQRPINSHTQSYSNDQGFQDPNRVSY